MKLNFLKFSTKQHPTKEINLEYLVKENAIGCLILNKNEDKALLVKQFRPGSNEEILEIPAGIIEKEEDPLETLYREIEEETGYLPENYEILYSSNPFWVSPGYSTEKLYLYIVKLKSNDTPPLPLKLDEGEDLKPIWVNIKEITNVTNDMKTTLILSLYWNIINRISNRKVSTP